MLRANAQALSVRVDDARLSGEFALLEVTTIPLVGPNLYLAPEADPADSLIAICSVGAKKEERERVSQWLEELVPNVAKAGNATTRVSMIWRSFSTVSGPAPSISRRCIDPRSEISAVRTVSSACCPSER
jgi:hypothetical protein